MKAFVDLSGCGTGAKKQYDLIRKARPQMFTRSEGAATHIIYWQCFTRDFAKLEQRRKRKKIVVRVGGFHRENAETTWRLLKVADGAIFVARWLMDFLKTRRMLGKTWRLPPNRTVIRNGSTWVGRKDAKTDYLLIRNAQMGDIRFKRGLNRVYSVWAMAQIWDRVREIYPELELWIVGRYEKKTKHEYVLPGWKWLGFKNNPRVYGQKAVALVHLVADFSPNSVVEALGEGIPVLVPSGMGGAAELAGYAGRHVRFVRTDKREFPEIECGGRFYRIDENSLFESVRDVMENRQLWQLAVRDHWKKYGDIEMVAKRYQMFLEKV